MLGQAAEQRCREACASYIDKYGGLCQFDGALIEGDLFASFNEILNVQINGLADVRQRLCISVPPRVTTFEGRTEGVPSVAPILEFVWLNGDLKNVRFHEDLTMPPGLLPQASLDGKLTVRITEWLHFTEPRQ
jgi:hypothetical protein